MKPVRVVSGAVAALDRSNVDTDQIVPKQFLKRIEQIERYEAERERDGPNTLAI